MRAGTAPRRRLRSGSPDKGRRAILPTMHGKTRALIPISTAEQKPATRRRKIRPVAGHQAPWRVRSPDNWRVPWRFGPQGQSRRV